MGLNLLDRNDDAISVLKQEIARSPSYLMNQVPLTAIYVKTERQTDT